MKKPNKAATVATALVVKKSVNRSPVDLFIAYNHAGRFPKQEVTNAVHAALGANPPKLTRLGFLVSKGSKGTLCHSVQTDEKSEFYSRPSGKSEAFGHLPTLAKIEKGLKVEIIPLKELLNRSLHAKTRVKMFKHRATGEEVHVVLLNPITDSYYVGLTTNEDGTLRVINMEPVAKYNKKNVQWVLVKEVSDPKLISRLTNMPTRTSKALLSK